MVCEVLLYRPIYDYLVFGFVIAIYDYVEIAVPSPLGDECFMKHINSQIKRAKGNELLL